MEQQDNFVRPLWSNIIVLAQFSGSIMESIGLLNLKKTLRSLQNKMKTKGRDIVLMPFIINREIALPRYSDQFNFNFKAPVQYYQ